MSKDRDHFEEFVKKNLGDIPVMDGGKYILSKINKYWLTWQAAIECKENQIKDLEAQLEAVGAGGMQAMKPSAPKIENGEWLRDGSLIYRLSEGRNADEINVNMAAGSRSERIREERAKFIFSLLTQSQDDALLPALKELATLNFGENSYSTNYTNLYCVKESKA
jgi:hypothetical protein